MSPSTSFFISDTDKDVGKIPPSTLFFIIFRGVVSLVQLGGLSFSGFWLTGEKVFWKVRGCGDYCSGDD